jgi:hypothetical protein
MCPNVKMTGMANLIIELVCAWLNLTTKLRLPQCSKRGKPKAFHFKKFYIADMLDMQSP